MKWTKLYGAVVAMLGMVGSAQAGAIVLTSHSCCGAEKSCGCAPSCQPQCCRPVICKPECPNIYNYQRTCAKPQCCCPAPTCAPKCAAPANCAAPAACAPAPANCAAPCGPAACGPANCAAPCAPKCAAPATCAAPCAPAPANCAAPCGPAAASCAAPCGPAPAKCCDNGCQKQCCADPCEVAHWIYESQTACHAKCRRKAIRKLGKYDCVCNPEIMCAFIYGLNDTDERVRKESAVQIRKQTKRNPCCCSCQVVAALTCALGDCDKGVVKAACKALNQCGYDVQDCCNQGCGGCTQTASCAAPGGDMTPAPAPEGGEAAPAPAPASAEPEAYFPSRLKNQQTKARKSALSNLFGVRG